MQFIWLLVGLVTILLSVKEPSHQKVKHRVTQKLKAFVVLQVLPKVRILQEERFMSQSLH